MSPIKFTIVGDDTDQFVTVFVPGRDPLPAQSSHPNFETIVKACLASLGGEPVDAGEVADLFDVGQTVERKFARLSERVTVQNGVVKLDGDPVETALTTQILRFLDEGEDFDPLVNFLEAIQSNPNDHSRQQAYDWLNNHDFTITTEGFVVGYKGVESDGNGGYRSLHSGTAYVNDVEHSGKIPNAVGDTVTMPRSEVNHDPSASCHKGLHIGTFDFAKSWSTSGVMLEVHVNPRDIVSVPTDAAGAKIRVCRYTVVGIIDAPIETAYKSTVTWDDAILTGADLRAGDRVEDEDGDWWTVTCRDSHGVAVLTPGDGPWPDDYVADDQPIGEGHYWPRAVRPGADVKLDNTKRDTAVRFVAGRPSQRDPQTGRFSG